jgi:signal transduction histidine kinase/DNA-binding response OmpR family regulator
MADTHEAIAGNGQAVPPDDDGKVKILIVDDLPEKLLVLSTTLESLGQNIVTARSGEEALRKVLEHEFAVILLDVNMPGMDGLETAAFLRRRKKSAHTPIIFITAFADELHTNQGYSLGAVDYILSPVVPEVLRTKVRVFVDLFRMTQQVRRQADERVALAAEQAARAAAEETSRQFQFLAEASTALARSLDASATLQTLARLAVPTLADVSAVASYDDDQPLAGTTELAWQAADGSLQTRSSMHLMDLPIHMAAVIQHVLVTGHREQLPNLGQWMPPDASEPLLLEGGVVLPLITHDRILGALTLIRKSLKCAHSGGVVLAEELAGRAAVALDNARLYQNIREGDRRKSEFLTMLAHELRNPMAPIRNAVQILRLTRSQEPHLVRARDMIDRQVTHMSRLIDDLLDMSRLSRGKILLRKEPLDLVQLVQATVEDYRSMLSQSGLKVQVHLPTEPMATVGDPTRLAQVVGNVLHNAGKFTDAGGEVALTLRSSDDGRWAVLCVHDTGIGIAPAMLANLFEPFSQADNSLDRTRGGLGLGLALVRGLVDLHDGDVRIASPGVGLGTEIIIRLPLVPTDIRLVRPDQADSPDVPALRILIIEDNPDTAESLRLMLTIAGHQVVVALNGIAGVEAAKDCPPDAVICDIGLPGSLNGYAVARALRHDAALDGTFLIASTGYGQEEDKRRCQEAGFDAHLTKPVDFETLQRVLSQRHTSSPMALEAGH